MESPSSRKKESNGESSSITRKKDSNGESSSITNRRHVRELIRMTSRVITRAHKFFLCLSFYGAMSISLVWSPPDGHPGNPSCTWLQSVTVVVLTKNRMVLSWFLVIIEVSMILFVLIAVSPHCAGKEYGWFPLSVIQNGAVIV